MRNVPVRYDDVLIWVVQAGTSDLRVGERIRGRILCSAPKYEREKRIRQG